MATLNTKSYVMGSGDKATAKYVIVAEQPGRQEVEQRRPMVGPAGQNLNECLREVGIDRDECYITNFIKDLDYDLKVYFDQRKKSPLQPPGVAYLNILKGELSRTSGILIAMGNAALWALTDRLGITNWRGSVVESTLLPGRKVVPTFHPATWTQEKLFRDPKLYLNRHMVIHDLHRAKMEYGHIEIRKTPRHVIIRPTFDESIAFLNECMKQSRVYYDIELLNNEMSCISFSYNDREAICIPFVDQTGQYFTVDEERYIMLKIAQILESPITKGGQNIIFDSHFIHARYGIQTINRDDTMIAQGILYPEYPKRLQFITALWTDINYYKSDGKIWLEGGGDWNNGFIYNGMDSIACAAAFPRQLSELEETGNIDAYRRQVELVEPLTYMMEHGVRIDIPGFANRIISNQMALQQKEAEIHDAMGEINPGSPTQLMDYFYRRKGLKPITNKKRRETTDESALIELAGKGHHEAQLILDWRELDKLASTYLNMDKIDKDGRMRCSYNPVGTSFGRISSSKNIFGTGCNLQNLPLDIRTYLIADPGYVIYSIDLSQAENRLVAYIGNVTPMIEAFETGTDVHKLTASLIYDTKYDNITPEQREWGKRANHCVSADTEVLSSIGWMPIKEAYETGCEIAQWDSRNQHITYAEPLEWFHETYSGPMYEFTGRYVSQFVTPEHRIPGLRPDGRFTINMPEFLSMKEQLKWPTSGYSQGSLDLDHTLLRLLTAFQADGGMNYGVTWNLKKPNKITRLETLLNMLGQEYTKRASGEFTVIYLKKGSITREYINTLFPDGNKLWNYNLLKMNQSALQVLTDEIFRWDSDGLNYWSKHYENIEFVQTLLHLTGHKCSIGMANPAVYRISKLQPHTRYPAIKKNIKYVNNIDIYCPTMPRDTFLIRHNGIISVSMNSFNYGQSPTGFSRLHQVPVQQAMRIRDAYFNAYPAVRTGYWAYVEDQLRRNNRTLSTLFGRRIRFLQQYGERLKNAAYSAIPQGTVGELINERGIKYIYYNDDSLFRTAEILTQTHDSIDFQVPLSAGFETHAHIIRKVIDSLETPLRFRQRDIRIPCDLVVNFNLNKKLGVEIKHPHIPKDEPTLARMLCDEVASLEASAKGVGRGATVSAA